MRMITHNGTARPQNHATIRLTRAKIGLSFRNEGNGPVRASGFSIACNLPVPCQFTLVPITTTPILVRRDFPKGHDSVRTRSLQPSVLQK